MKKKVLLVALAALAGMLYAQQAFADKFTSCDGWKGQWAVTFSGGGSTEVVMNDAVQGGTDSGGNNYKCWVAGRRQDTFKYVVILRGLDNGTTPGLTTAGSIAFYDDCNDIANIAGKNESIADLGLGATMTPNYTSPTAFTTSNPGTAGLTGGTKRTNVGGVMDLARAKWRYRYSQALDTAPTDTWGPYINGYLDVVFDNETKIWYNANPGGAPAFLLFPWLISGTRSDGKRVTFFEFHLNAFGGSARKVYTLESTGTTDDYLGPYSSKIASEAFLSDNYSSWGYLDNVTFPTKTNTYGLYSARRVCKDRDHDGYYTGEDCTGMPHYPAVDCNDADNLTNPAAADNTCDGKDQNCDGNFDEGYAGPKSTYYRDADGDGYGAGSPVTVCTANPPAGYVANSDDCNDSQGSFWFNTYYRDADGDGYGNVAATTHACSQPTGYVTNTLDCDDTRAAVKPGALELCNGRDDDCDGATDEGFTYGGAAIGAACDGIGACGVGTVECYDVNTATCSTNPNGTNRGDVPETCNYLDDDCDGSTDEGFDLVGACTNGVGICLRSGNKVCSGGVAVCDAVPGPANPGGEIACNGLDDDCDGDVDEGSGNTITYYRDADGDGYGIAADTQSGSDCFPISGYATTSGDCDDTDPLINPGAQERCNGKDDDCNGVIDDNATNPLPQHIFYRDADNDTYGNLNVTTQACAAPPGYTDNNSDIDPEGVFDCNDNITSINPGGTEVCNGIDDNCNGQTDEGLTYTTYYRDADNDGYGNPAVTTQTCTGSAPTGYVANSSDCNDSFFDATLPGTVYYQDFDGDTYGNPAMSTFACAPSGNYDVTNTLDCDDTDNQAYPGVAERCNGKDDNCNGQTDEGVLITYYFDGDGDGYGLTAVTTQACTAPTGYAANSGDCNDADNRTNPGAKEICNEIDDNCNGQTDEFLIISYYLDADGDGYGTGTASTGCSVPAGYASASGDCNDANAKVNPGAFEITGNGIDDDCNGLQDENAPGTCEYWKGKWAFTFKTKTDNVTITSICYDPHAGEAGNTQPACMVNQFGKCEAQGTRASDGQEITISQVYMDQRIYVYYETWSPGSTTPYDAVHYRDFLDEAAYKANPFGYTGGYTEMIADIITDCDFVAAIDGTFKVYSQANPDGAPYASAFGLVSGERLGVVCPTDNVTKCVDKDGDGYGDNCTLGSDCDDNDNMTHPGATEVCNGKDDDCDGVTDEGCGNVTDCILKVVPKQIFKLFAFLNPFIPFVISAESDSGVVFARPFDIDWGTDAIKTLLRLKIGNRIIVGFMFARPLQLESDNYTVVVTYGDNETEECGKIEVK